MFKYQYWNVWNQNFSYNWEYNNGAQNNRTFCLYKIPTFVEKKKTKNTKVHKKKTMPTKGINPKDGIAYLNLLWFLK